MTVKMMAAVVAVAGGEKLNVTRVCREGKVTRTTFYKYVDRFRVEGLAGLEERSRRPLRSPQQMSAEVEEIVVLLRKQLADAGWDHGAVSIQSKLVEQLVGTGWRVPSVAGVHRALVRRGLVTAQPQKRPKSSWRRFEAAAPNEVWQIDSTEWTIACGTVHVFSLLDDHSRLAARCRAVIKATGEEAWTTFCQAAQRWGLPAGVLSDNGLCFSGKLRGFEVLFEARLRDAGIVPKSGRPFHPQTTGKVERFQQTLKKWLRRQPLAADLAGLQAQLDEFCDYYNNQRPHQGIGRRTPASRWHASSCAQPSLLPVPHPQFPTRPANTTVTTQGTVWTNHFNIHIGVEWAGQDATVILDGQRASIFIDGHLVRHLELDPDHTYQPSGRPRGGPRRQRQ